MELKLYLDKYLYLNPEAENKYIIEQYNKTHKLTININKSAKRENKLSIFSWLCITCSIIIYLYIFINYIQHNLIGIIEQLLVFTALSCFILLIEIIIITQCSKYLSKKTNRYYDNNAFIELLNILFFRHARMFYYLNKGKSQYNFAMLYNIRMLNSIVVSKDDIRHLYDFINQEQSILQNALIFDLQELCTIYPIPNIITTNKYLNQYNKENHKLFNLFLPYTILGDFENINEVYTNLNIDNNVSLQDYKYYEKRCVTRPISEDSANQKLYTISKVIEENEIDNRFILKTFK